MGAAPARWVPACLALAAACGGRDADLLEASLADRHPAVVRAVEAAREVVRTTPSDAQAWGGLALAQHANGLHDLAVPCYARAAELDPRSARWPYLAARALRDLGRDADALAQAERALALEPATPGARWVVGQTHLEAGELEPARAAFEETVRLAPDEPGGWCGLARVELLAEAPERALSALQRALAADGADRYAHNLEALALRRLGRLDEAKREQELGKGGLPDWVGPWDEELRAARVATGMVRWEAARDLYDAGHVPEAIALLEGVHAEEPENHGLSCFLADAYVRAGRLEDARRLYEETLARSPDQREALVGLAEALGRGGELPRALRTIRRAIELYPEDGRAHHAHGVLLKRNGDRAAAIEAFRRSLYLDQRNPTTRLSIGVLELELQRFADARTTFGEATEATPEDGRAWLGLGRADLGYGDLEGASTALGRAEASGSVARPELDELRDAIGRKLGRRLTGGGT